MNANGHGLVTHISTNNSCYAPPSSPIPRVFFGEDGLRAGWRFLIFVVLLVMCVVAIRLGLRQIPPLRRVLDQAQSGTMTPSFEFVFEPAVIAGLFLVTFLMAKIERRSFWSYGFPLKGAFGKLFWQGAIWGLAMESIETFAIYVLHGFSFGSLALSGFPLMKYALLWAFAFVLVGIFEEFSFRGYAQFTLARGIGCWPAAILLSALFGSVHLENPREGWIGALSCWFLASLPALPCSVPAVCGLPSDGMRREIMPKPWSIRFRTAE